MSRVIDAIIKLTDKFSQPMSKTIQTMTEAGRAGNQMRKTIEKAGNSIASVGKGITAAVTMPVVGVGVACTNMALDFENSIAKVSTIADTAAMSLDLIRTNTISLSNALGVSVAEISEAQYNAISAGAATADSLTVVETAIKAAKAGFTDAATAVDGLTTVFNSYAGAVDYERLADQMLLTQNYGKTTFGELASSIGQVTPLANSLNVSTEELFSSIAVLTKNGINTSSAITGMKAAYSNILKPTSDAAKTAERLGIDFSATHLKAVGWAKFMEEIRIKANGNSDAMASLFGSVEALNSMTVLAGAGAADFTDCLEQMQTAAGLTQSSYEKMLTPSERWNISLNKIKNSGLQIGTKLLPVFEKVSGVVQIAADKVSNLSDEQLESVIKIAGAAAAIGPVITIFGKLVVMSSKVLGVVSKIKGAGSVVKLAMSMITSPAGIVIGALLAIVAAGILVYKNWDKIKASIQNFAQKCSPQLEMVRRAFEIVKSAVMQTSDRASELADRAISMAITIQNGMKPLINFMMTVFEVGIMSVISAVSGYFLGFSTSVGTIIDGVITMLNGLLDFITGVFTGNWDFAWNGVVTVFTGIFQGITGIAKGTLNGVSGAINSVVRTINGMGITIPEWVPGIGGNEFRLNIPQIPQLARGTSFWGGGIAQVHERGGEIIDLPRGSRVYPHDKSVQIAKKSGGMKIVIAKLADQIIVREESDIDKIADRVADRIVKKIMRADGNMGGEAVGDMA